MEKDRIDKKDHILDVAEKVFSEQGYDGASTRTISGEAGVNMAMLNYYFGSKEGLFLAIFDRKILFLQNILQNLGNAENMTALDKVQKYVDVYVDRILNNNCFQKMLYQEISMSKRSDLTDKIAKILMINVHEFHKILSDGIASGEFSEDIDMELISATIYGTKNFMINTPILTSSMLGYDIQDEKNLEEKLKPRIKAYLKKLLKSYLLHEYEHTN